MPVGYKTGLHALGHSFSCVAWRGYERAFDEQAFAWAGVMGGVGIHRLWTALHAGRESGTFPSDLDLLAAPTPNFEISPTLVRFIRLQVACCSPS